MGTLKKFRNVKKGGLFKTQDGQVMVKLCEDYVGSEGQDNYIFNCVGVEENLLGYYEKDDIVEIVK